MAPEGTEVFQTFSFLPDDIARISSHCNFPPSPNYFPILFWHYWKDNVTLNLKWWHPNSQHVPFLGGMRLLSSIASPRPPHPPPPIPHNVIRPIQTTPPVLLICIISMAEILSLKYSPLSACLSVSVCLSLCLSLSLSPFLLYPITLPNLLSLLAAPQAIHPRPKHPNKFAPFPCFIVCASGEIFRGTLPQIRSCLLRD